MAGGCGMGERRIAPGLWRGLCSAEAPTWVGLLRTGQPAYSFAPGVA